MKNNKTSIGVFFDQPNIHMENNMTQTISQLAKMDFVKREMARLAWKCLRVNLDEWTYDVSNALPHRKHYEKKYFLVRLPYTMKFVNLHWSNSVLDKFGFVNKTIKDQVTHDHFIGSYTVGECALDNPEKYLIGDETLQTFTEELYPYTFITNYVTQSENKVLSGLKGKVLTKDKYKTIGIKLYDNNSNPCENPELPEGFTEWENNKYFGSSLSEFMC